MRKSNKKNTSSDAWFSKKTILTLIVLALPAITPVREIKISLNVVINGSINTPSSSH